MHADVSFEEVFEPRCSTWESLMFCVENRSEIGAGKNFMSHEYLQRYSLMNWNGMLENIFSPAFITKPGFSSSMNFQLACSASILLAAYTSISLSCVYGGGAHAFFTAAVFQVSGPIWYFSFGSGFDAAQEEDVYT